jgi:hypothetical protein
MKHPNEFQLALFAGGDLGFWNRWQVSRHVARCAQCSGEVAALRSVQDDVRDVASELPKDLNWDRLSQEMTGNIRVGLAAGEAIARFDRPARRPLRLRWNAAMVLAGATAIFGIAFWTSVPPAQKDHLLAALRRIPQAHATVEPDEVMIEASSTAIEVKDHGRTLSLTHPHSDGVTVSVSMRGSAGVRYVDADTGQVTTNKVYYDSQ